MKPFSGREVAPDVEKLMRHYRDKLEPNAAVEYAAVAEIIGVPVTSNRFRTVLHAFRRAALRELNVDFRVESSYGLIVLFENERVSAGVHDFNRAGKRLGKAVDRIAKSDVAKLDAMHLQQRDHAVRIGAEVVEASRKAQKQIAMSGKVTVLPRKSAEEKS